ncbi:MAG: glutamine--tRNA ligase/YqeY domain fusion protein [Candidatus Heimdallarchaeota archaeon]
MKSIEDICEKYALQNALEHGKAEVGPIMNIIMSLHPEFRKDAQKVKEILEEKVEYVNAKKQKEIQQLIQQKFPDLLHTEVEEKAEGVDFIRSIINEDNKTGKFGGKVHTRFPPEPNGFLHIGHAMTINLNSNLAKEYGGKFNLRFDDTNPRTEEMEYVEGIIEDVKWLGGNFEDRLFYASNYFDQLFDYAVQLVKKGICYVDDQTIEEIRENRGNAFTPGKNSPFRDRSVEENLDLFERMKKGEFPNGARVLRAKIDMKHPNLLMRDPILYRILHEPHHNTKDKWCIYPMYDWAHGLEDSIEGITHSICTLEFEVHRELYDWYLEQLDDKNGKPIFHPQQIEFARVNVSNTVLSKRKMLQLVKEGHVDGWDDPRMLTVVGLKRRGISSKAISDFSKSIGVSKRDKIIDISMLNKCVRDDLNHKCSRVMSVLNPLKLVITNYPEDKEESIIVLNHHTNKEFGSRKVIFTKELYIERDDFMEKPTKDFLRLSLGKEIRLKYAYVVKCDKIVKDKKTKEITEIHCSYDPKSKSGSSETDKVYRTIHWISAVHSVPAEFRLYNDLFSRVNPLDPEEGKEFTDYINPDSLVVLKGFVEPHLKKVKISDQYQFERQGYFNVDLDSTKDKLVFNRTIPLRDSYSKK